VSKAAFESAEHMRLKALALQWAQASGYPIAAAEVTLPDLRCRIDVAAYRPGKVLTQSFDGAGQPRRRRWVPALGATAVFECKASRADYLRDSRSLTATAERLERLAARRVQYEEVLKLYYPSIRNGDTLFPEYETFEFERPGYEPYQRLIGEIRRLNARLHLNTKFEQLVSWKAANLHYVVTSPGLFRPHELPFGWGLLIANGQTLELAIRPLLCEADEAQRLALLHRIAMAGTRAVHRSLRVAQPASTEGPFAG
jgi:hypothetical protein